MKWYEKEKCIALSYEQMTQNTNPLFPLPTLFSSSEAVDETKPKESARQDEGKGEEREADQEHAWTLRNGFPRPHPPLSWALSLPTLFSTPLWSFPSCPAHIRESVLSYPLALFLSVWQTFKKKKKKQERSQVKQCGLNIFCFLVLLWRVFGNDDPIILGNSCTVSKFFDLVRVALWESTFLSISLCSKCVCNVPFIWGVQNIEWIQNHFSFPPLNVMEWTKRKKNQKPSLFWK